MTVDDSGRTQEQIDKKEQIKALLQRNLATKSSCSKQIFAEKAGHNINYDQPEIIIETVQQMVDEIRANMACKAS